MAAMNALGDVASWVETTAGDASLDVDRRPGLDRAGATGGTAS